MEKELITIEVTAYNDCNASNSQRYETKHLIKVEVTRSEIDKKLQDFVDDLEVSFIS